MSNNNNSGSGNKHKTGKFEQQDTLADEIINSERFAQIIGAVVAGKYSWACVLLLVWANYNPMHYIPFRTYKRLVKENIQNNKENRIKEVNKEKSQRSEQVKITKR